MRGSTPVSPAMESMVGAPTGPGWPHPDGVRALVAGSRPARAEGSSLASDALELARRCADDVLKTVLSCGAVAALAPETMGASLLTLAPCAAQSASLGRCIAEELREMAENAAHERALQLCSDAGGVPLSEDGVLTCIMLR